MLLWFALVSLLPGLRPVCYVWWRWCSVDYSFLIVSFTPPPPHETLLLSQPSAVREFFPEPCRLGKGSFGAPSLLAPASLEEEPPSEVCRELRSTLAYGKGNSLRSSFLRPQGVPCSWGNLRFPFTPPSFVVVPSTHGSILYLRRFAPWYCDGSIRLRSYYSRGRGSGNRRFPACSFAAGAFGPSWASPRLLIGRAAILLISSTNLLSNHCINLS